MVPHLPQLALILNSLVPLAPPIVVVSTGEVRVVDQVAGGVVIGRHTTNYVGQMVITPVSALNSLLMPVVLQQLMLIWPKPFTPNVAPLLPLLIGMLTVVLLLT